MAACRIFSINCSVPFTWFSARILFLYNQYFRYNRNRSNIFTLITNIWCSYFYKCWQYFSFYGLNKFKNLNVDTIIRFNFISFARFIVLVKSNLKSSQCKRKISVADIINPKQFYYTNSLTIIFKFLKWLKFCAMRFLMIAIITILN